MIPQGYEEVVPEGYEEVGATKAPSDSAVQPLKNALGGVDAAANMLAGLPSYIYSGYAGLSKLMTGQGIDAAGNAVQQAQESNFGMGAPRPFTKEGGEVADMLSHGVDFVKEKAGDVGAKIGGELGRTNAEIAAEVGLNFLPLPGSRGIKRLGRAIEEKLPSRAPKGEIPAGYEEITPQAKTPQENTWMERQMGEGEAQALREQQFADKNNIQGELDLRPKDMPLDENGMPVDMARSLDAQEATSPHQPDLFNEETRYTNEKDRTQQFEAIKRQEEQLKHQYEQTIESNPGKQSEIEAAYAQRQRQLFDQAESIKKELHEDTLSRLEDDLRKGADTPKGDGQGPKTRGFKDRQRGGLDIQEMSDGFRALLDGGEVGRLKSNLTPDQSRRLGETANVDMVKVAPEMRGKGVGSALYDAWNDAHEGRIAPSGKTTQQAWNVWKKKYPEKVDAFVAQEVQRLRSGADVQTVVGNITDPSIAQRVLSEATSKQSGFSRGQRGAIDFEGITEGLKKLFPQSKVEVPTIQNIVGKNMIPKDPVVPEILSKALAEGKDGKGFTNTASGSTLEGMTRRSSAIEGASRLVQNALKRAELYTQKTIFPIEKQFREMKLPEVEKLHKVFLEEMFSREKMTAEQLHDKGLTEAQMRAYAGMRKGFENALSIQNKARSSLGLEPISGKEYYFGSTWKGDFRQPIYNKEGKLVWYMAADSKLGLNKQVKAVLDKFPDLVADEKLAHKVKVSGLGKSELQTVYSTVLDVLGRDDPKVQQIKDAYEASLAQESYSAIGQKKHFERKANIRGFVGDRPTKNMGKEALEAFQFQIQYMKNAYKWSALQEASKPMQELLSNEQLREQQPNNVKYIEDYWNNAIGNGSAKWIKAAEDAFRELGVSPSVIDRAVGGMKSYFITSKLAVSVGTGIAQTIQTLNTIPHLIDTMVKQGGNPVKALSTGLPAGIGMAASHYLGKAGPTLAKDFPTKFMRDAFQYAEDNGITSRSVYDEAPINQRGVISKGLNVVGKTISIPDTLGRSISYMTFVQMLKDTGKFKDPMSIYQKAEELTNASMVDYRREERPLGFSKLGTAGNALNTLQTFPMNLYNQYRYFGKEAIRGNVGPLLAMFALQYALAGAVGIPGFQDFDKLVTWGKGMLPDNVYAKVKDFDPKLWMIEHLGESSVYGALSTHTGVSLTNRLSAPSGGDMLQAPGGPVVDLAKQVGSVGGAMADPMNSTKRAQAIHDVAPTGIQGYLETGPLKDENAIERNNNSTLYKKASDLSARQGQYARTPEEETIRKLGLRSQKEALSNDLNYKVSSIEKQVNDHSKSLVDKYYDAIRRGDQKKIVDIQNLYVELNGKSIQNDQLERQMLDEYTTTLERKSISAKNKLEALKGIARINSIMEQRNANNGRTP